jgi:hypothetical protein
MWYILSLSTFLKFFVVLKIETRALHMQGKCSTTKLYSQSLSYYGCFKWSEYEYIFLHLGASLCVKLAFKLSFRWIKLFLSFFFFVGLGFELRTCLQSKTVPHEPHLRTSILLGLFWQWGLANCLPGLASNSDPPNFILPSS